jgi:hypothetical protein
MLGSTILVALHARHAGTTAAACSRTRRMGPTPAWTDVEVVVIADDGVFVGLADAVEALREELDVAWQQGVTQRVRFRVSAVTLTVQAVARTESGQGGKVRWWLVEGGMDRRGVQEATQTLELTLTPQLHDAAGNPSPLDVAGQQSAPGN